jgi:hypothetical protein
VTPDEVHDKAAAEWVVSCTTPWYLRWSVLLGGVAAGALFLLIGVGASVDLPFLPTSLFRFLWGYLPLASVLVIFGVGFAQSRLRDYLLCRSGEVLLYGNRVVILKDLPARQSVARVVTWAELSAYEDASPEFVQLYTQDEAKPLPTLTIPTPTEQDRVMVLELLDHAGVARRS